MFEKTKINNKGRNNHFIKIKKAKDKKMRKFWIKQKIKNNSLISVNENIAWGGVKWSNKLFRMNEKEVSPLLDNLKRY